jgi:hypothetical protein
VVHATFESAANLFSSVRFILVTSLANTGYGRTGHRGIAFVACSRSMHDRLPCAWECA